MVLQNKYKARASRKYKAAHGIPEKPKTGNVSKDKVEETNSVTKDNEPDPVQDEERVLHRHPLKSNTWRYEESDTDEEAEPEPDIDITGLQNKVLEMDINARMQGQVPGSESEDESDDWDDQSSRKAQLEILKNVDWDEIQREKQDSEAARALKERFQRQTQGGYSAATWRRVDGSQVSVPQKARKNRVASDATSPHVRAAERVHSAQGTKASLRFVPRPTAAQTGSSAQDIDDFLRDINASDSAKGPASSSSAKISVAPMKNDMQDFLDDVLG